MNHHWPGRRFVLWGFLAFFGGLTFLFLLSMGLTLALLTDFPLLNVRYPYPGRALFVLCLAPVGFFILAGIMGSLSFRRFGRPIAEILSAIDAVARGDLTIRLNENGSRPVRALVRSFNRMVVELERAEQQRRTMTADIAHELRNPLHIIQGNLEGMLDGVYEPSPENLSATLDETRLLARLVADLQTLSLAETGQLPLHPTRFLVADLLADVAASFASRAAEQGVELQTSATAELELLADYDRLDQVLSNLVANALHFTPGGGRIRLDASPAGDLARIVVSDTGVGIPPDELPYIFDRFWKGDRSRRRDGSGSGLGLAIARQLVRAHNGVIEASSQPGQGASFTIELPRPPS